MGVLEWPSRISEPEPDGGVLGGNIGTSIRCEALKATLCITWVDIMYKGSDYVDRLVESMPARLQVVIDAGAIPYWSIGGEEEVRPFSLTEVVHR